MIAMHALRMASLAFLLAGCSAHMLEDVGEIAPPRSCAETTKLFNTFSMRATRVAWTGDALTLELVFDNDKDFPAALSNSGNGVLYAVELSLQGGKGGSVAPKEASGILLVREAKQPEKPKSRSVFGQPTPHTKPPKPPTDNTRDVNFPIKPGAPEQGKLVFHAPRDNYVLTIERKFAGKPMSGQPTDHIAVCKISAG
jgi:hypothetical protein